MSVSGISGSNVFALVQAEKNQASQSQSTQNSQNPFRQVQDEFTQLGQDLQSGNLTQAQQDFTALSSAISSLQGGPGTLQTGSGGSGSSRLSSIQQAFNSLQQDLQAGNVTGAQQDFGALQQALQSGGGGRGHHRHHGGGNSQETSAIQQDFNALGQSLQSGNLTGAQTSFAQLQQDLQQFTAGGSSGSSSSSTSGASTPSAGSTLNVTA
jgi:outer membrane protein assembly factor BamD (BamD/ComL family)